uniref:Rho-GAP domain-containing protein n=1 Tax=Panagrolaimus sp. JU765 TaxID=591449 RepID=A0AC34QW53_9BILA
MMLFGKRNKDKKLAKQSSKSDLNDKNVPSSNQPVLGVPLSVAVKNSRSHDGIPVPALVRQCIDYVEQHGLEMEGIYRVSAPISRLDELEKQANSGGKIGFVDPHDAAGLLKRFLRQLPDHLLGFPPLAPSSFENVANSCHCKSDVACTCEAVEHLKEMLKRAPKENFYLIAYVFLHARHVVDKVWHLSDSSNKLISAKTQ